jgi:hypothetical protein
LVSGGRKAARALVHRVLGGDRREVRDLSRSNHQIRREIGCVPAGKRTRKAGRLQELLEDGLDRRFDAAQEHFEQ